MSNLAIDPADRLRIESAVLSAERETAGEIVVLVVQTCDGYRGARWRAAVGFAGLASLGWLALGWPISPLGLVGLQAASVAVAFSLCQIDGVLRRFLSETLMERRAQQRAAAGFHQHGLSQTEGRTGILLFVARLEHRVVVLADEGVHATLNPNESWQDVVSDVLDGARDGRLTDGILAGVERIGGILARHLPAARRNLDELPTALILEDH